MGVQFILEGGSLLISYSEYSKDRIWPLTLLHDATKHFSAGEARREAVETEKIKIYLIKNHNDKKILINSANNLEAAEKMVNEVIATRNHSILYAIMYKNDKEMIVCQLLFEEDGKPFWGVMRTPNKFCYREINYFTDILSSAHIYILKNRPA